MKFMFTLLTLAFFTMPLLSQNITDFEDFDVEQDSAVIDAGASGFFDFDYIRFPNFFNGFWSGWAISAGADGNTPGYENEFSAKSGGGFENSKTYGIGFGETNKFELMNGQNTVESFYINNSTVTYFIIKDGNQFSKAFGGPTMNDPDYFLLTIKGYLDGVEKADSVDFYLADYRFSDNSMDYIVEDWTKIDVSSIGMVDSLKFFLSSTDTGMFGMNTPAYFCLDNIVTGPLVNSVENTQQDFQLAIAPNPTADFLNIRWEETIAATALVFNINGQALSANELRYGQNTINVQNLPNGMYVLKVQTAEGFTSLRFMKH